MRQESNSMISDANKKGKLKMLSISFLPHLNAILNTIAACFLMGGFIFIKGGNREAHQICMIVALIISSLFLISYVIHRFYVPIFVFQGEGSIRIFYYILLISHVFLAITIVPLIAITVIRAFRKKLAAKPDTPEGVPSFDAEWWAWLDSNQRPDRYERPALTN